MKIRSYLRKWFLHLFLSCMSLSLLLVGGEPINASVSDDKTINFDFQIVDMDGGFVNGVEVTVLVFKDGVFYRAYKGTTNAQGKTLIETDLLVANNYYYAASYIMPSGYALERDGFFGGGDSISLGASAKANHLNSHSIRIFKSDRDMSSGDKGFFSGLIQSILDGFTNLIVNPLKNALEALGNFIIEGIKGLFVPKQETLTTFKESVMDKLNTKLGFIGQSIDYAVIKPVEMLTGITGTQTSLNLPPISIFGRTIIDIDYDLTMITQPPFKTFYDIYYTVVSFGLVTGFIAYIYSKYKGVISS